MQITILGNVCIDKNITEKANYTSAGGPAVFMQKIFSQLPDAYPTIVAPFGKDFLDYSQELSLFTTNPKGNKTLVYENIITGTIRTQKAENRDDAKPITIDKTLLRLLQKTDILLLTPLLPNMSVKYIKELVANTSPDTLVVLLPQGYYRDFKADDTVIVRKFSEAADILPLVDILIVSEEDGKDMHEKSKEWSKKYDLISIVTLGKKGAVAFEKGKEILLPTEPVPQKKIIDSIGSGDIFSASFAYAYKKTKSIEKAGTFANAIARERLFFSTDSIHIVPPNL